MKIRVYYASTDNILSELCQNLVRSSTSEPWVAKDPKKPWSRGFLGLTKKYEGYPDPVCPKVAPTSSITAAVIDHSPPKVEILFSEAENPDKLACIYSTKDTAHPTMWTWGTKYVGDKPADTTFFIPKEKPPVPEPTPSPRPSPDPRPFPLPRPASPIRRRRDRNRYPYVILGTGFGFIVGFIVGIVLYEPFGNSRGGRSNLWR